jgi:hypothetical protein
MYTQITSMHKIIGTYTQYQTSKIIKKNNKSNIQQHVKIIQKPI